MKKFLSKVKYWATTIGLLLSNILLPTYPVAYALKFLKKWNPLWIVLDDSRFVEGKPAPDYRTWLFNHGYSKPTIIAEARWMLGRNRMWNLKRLLKTKPQHPTEGNQKIKVIEFVKDNLHLYDGTKLSQDGIYEMFAGLKFIGQPGDDPWQVWSGEIASEKHSILGEGYIWYEVDGTLYWRKTSCKEVEYKIFGKTIWKGYLTIKLGYNHKGQAFHFKHQKIKGWGTWE